MVAEVFDEGSVVSNGGEGTVEGAVAEDDSGEFGLAEDGVLEGPEGVEREFELSRRGGVEVVFFGLETDAFGSVGPAGEALGDEFLDACVDGGGSEVAGAFGAELVGEEEVAVEVAEVDAGGDGGELVDDDLRFCFVEGFADGRGVECVEEDGCGSERADAVGVGGVAEGSVDLVLFGEEKRDEGLSDGSGCACEEDLHSGFILPWCRASAGVGCGTPPIF